MSVQFAQNLSVRLHKISLGSAKLKKMCTFIHD